MSTPAIISNPRRRTSHSADLPVVLETSGGVQWRGALVEFLLDNRAELTLNDIQTICAVLEVDGSYAGGGGAAPSYTLRKDDAS